MPYVAAALNDLGLYDTKRMRLKTPEVYNEALEIYRNLAQSTPQAYLPDVAVTLNNLANLQYKKGVKSPEVAPRRRWRFTGISVRSNPQTYLPYVAGTINNLKFALQEGRV